MSELKRVDILEKPINAWLKKNNFEEISAKLGFDFCYLWDEEQVRFGLFVPSEVPAIWNYRLRKWGCENFYGDFVTAFLHEVGHHNTLHLCNDFQYLYSMIMKRLIQFIPSKTLRNYIYFGLPIEKIATKWAIHYMNTHAKECEALRDTAFNSMNEFFKINECDENVFKELLNMEIAS